MKLQFAFLYLIAHAKMREFAIQFSCASVSKSHSSSTMRADMLRMKNTRGDDHWGKLWTMYEYVPDTATSHILSALAPHFSPTNARLFSNAFRPYGSSALQYVSATIRPPYSVNGSRSNKCFRLHRVQKHIRCIYTNSWLLASVYMLCVYCGAHHLRLGIWKHTHICTYVHMCCVCWIWISSVVQSQKPRCWCASWRGAFWGRHVLPMTTTLTMCLRTLVHICAVFLLE